jgi:GT2 family glycosyltransferase
MLNASVVLYHTPAAEVQKIVRLLRACPEIDEIWLIDNSEIMTEAFMFLPATYIFNNKNLGYGRAHNIALEKSLKTNAKYHLVLNSDIEFTSDVITQLTKFMNENPDIGHAMPLVRYPNGNIQYLAKQLPSPFDLFARRFMPKSWFKNHTAKFENHAFYQNNNYKSQLLDVPYLSGCFMFLRCDALRKVGLFDPRFFMYPEDIDLTRRIHQLYRTVMYPAVEITHNHAQSSYHSFRLLCIHITNMIKYFCKWGFFR